MQPLLNYFSLCYMPSDDDPPIFPEADSVHVGLQSRFMTEYIDKRDTLCLGRQTGEMRVIEH